MYNISGTSLLLISLSLSSGTIRERSTVKFAIQLFSTKLFFVSSSPSLQKNLGESLPGHKREIR